MRKKDNGKIYAMKVLNKKNIIEVRFRLLVARSRSQRSEIEHTKTEKDILQKLVHPFLVNLYFSFQSVDKLYASFVDLASLTSAIRSVTLSWTL